MTPRPQLRRAVARAATAACLLASSLAIVSLTPTPAGAAALDPDYAFGDYSPSDGGATFELSGLAPANNPDLPNSYWGVRDYSVNGNRTKVYRLEYDPTPSGANGFTIVQEIDVTGWTSDGFDDWEAVATDSAGNLYVGDTGTGGSNRSSSDLRRVYRIDAAALELASNNNTSAAVSKTWTYTPGSTLPGNGEAMFSYGDEIYIVNRGATARVGRLDQASTSVVAVAVPALTNLNQITAAEMSTDGRTLSLLHERLGTDDDGDALSTAYDVDPATNPDTAVIAFFQDFVDGDYTSVGYSDSRDFEGLAFADLGVTINGSEADADDTTFALMVTDVAAGNNDQVFRVPANAYREIDCTAAMAADGDHADITWDLFDQADSYWLTRQTSNPDQVFWQGNIGENVERIEQSVPRGLLVDDEMDYILFPRWNEPGGSNNLQTGVSFVCGSVTVGDSQTCDVSWDGSNVNVTWNRMPSNVDRVSIHQSVDGAGLVNKTAVNSGTYETTITPPGTYSTLRYEVWARQSNGAVIETAECGILRNTNTARCDVNIINGEHVVDWDRYDGLTRMRIERQVNRPGVSPEFSWQSFLGTNGDTLIQSVPAGNWTSADYRVIPEENGVEQAVINCGTITN